MPPPSHPLNVSLFRTTASPSSHLHTATTFPPNAAESMMIAVIAAQIPAWLGLLAALGPDRLWYAVPLVVSVSLVYAATRHEQFGPILGHAIRFSLWIIMFMAIIAAGIQLLSWFQ